MKLKNIPVLMMAAFAAIVSCAQLQEPSHGTTEGIDPSAPGAVQLVHIDRDTIGIVKEYSRCLRGTAYPSEAVDKDLLWSSMDEHIASVNDTGLVSGLSAGVTKIVLSSKSLPLTDTCVVIVYENIHVERVEISQTEATLLLGSKLELSASVLPADARIPDIEWSSDNEEIAKVNAKGVVTPVAEGVAHIKATAVENGKNAVCTVTVERIKVTGITLSKTELTLEPDGVSTLKATVAPADATIPTYTWSSSDESVATVADGRVTAVGLGNAVITATTDDGGFTAQCAVTVKKKEAAGKIVTLTIDLKNPPASCDMSALVADGSISFTVTGVDGDGKSAEYEMSLFYGSGAGAKPSWNADNYIVLNAASYLGTPVIPGGTLKSLTFTQSAKTNAKRKSTMASETHAGALKTSYYDAAVEAMGKSIVTGDQNMDYTYTIESPVKEKSYYLLCVASGIGVSKLVLTYEVEVQPITLDFDFSGAALPGWPTASHTHIDGGTKCVYPLNGVDYEFILADCNGAGTCNVWWNTGGYIVLSTKYRYFGLPALQGYKLVKVVGTHATKNSSTRNVGIANQIEENNVHPEDATGHGYVTGGEPICWTTKGAQYTYNLSDTVAGRVYYIYLQNSGVGFSHLTLTYDPE